MKRGIDVFALLDRLPKDYLKGLYFEFWPNNTNFKISREIGRNILRISHFSDTEDSYPITFYKGDLKDYGVEIVRSTRGIKVIAYRNDSE